MTTIDRNALISLYVGWKHSGQSLLTWTDTIAKSPETVVSHLRCSDTTADDLRTWTDSGIAWPTELQRADETFAEEFAAVAATKGSDTLCLVGCGPTRVGGIIYAREHPGTDCWTLNKTCRDKESTLHFELHGGSRHAHIQERVKEAGLLPRPVVVEVPGIPDTLTLPIGTMMTRLPNYYANTIAYMAALACLLEYKTVRISGCDYYDHVPAWVLLRMDPDSAPDEMTKEEWIARNDEFLRHESVWERPCTEYWLGFLQARGIGVTIPQRSFLMATGPEAPDGDFMPERRPYHVWSCDETIGKRRRETFTRSAADTQTFESGEAETETR